MREDGGISIVAHPCVPTMNYQTPDIMDYDALEILNGSMAPYGPLFDVVQGRKMWHALLSKGHRIAAVGDSDCHDVTSGRARRMLKDPAAAIRSDKRIGMIAMLVDFKTVIEPWGWKGLHVGTYRTYLHLDAVTPQDVQAAVQAGRGFVTNGPLLVATLDGELPGSEVTIGDRPKLTLAAELVANRPLQRLDVLVNGEVAMSVQPADSQVNLEVPVKAGDWVTAELFGPWPEFATTNAWYVR